MSSLDSQLQALIAAHGKEAVTAAALRALPVTTFEESNATLTKYKEELVVLHRLITNLEWEVRRQADEVKALEKNQYAPPLSELSNQ